ncbi:MAG: hypothetical protein ACPH8A_07115 [Flavobacteriaceae bacterium]
MMKKLLFLFFVIVHSSCVVEDDLDCGEWEYNRSSIWNVGKVSKKCESIFDFYANSFYAWSGDLNIINENGEVYNQQLSELNASILGANLPPNVVKLDYPINGDDYYQQNEEYPIPLMLDFISPDKLNFIIDSEVYDPFIESIVNYNGTGRIKDSNGNISLEFNCEFNYGGISYSVSCNLTHNLKTLR